MHAEVDRALHARGCRDRSAGRPGRQGPWCCCGGRRGCRVRRAPPAPRARCRPAAHPPPGGPPPFDLGAPVPQPRSARRRHRPVLVAAAVGGWWPCC
ncbi:hypothetical protein O1L55_26275 [Streptomyces albulus]|nr:hypothetical protein [Streptomyces noursei]